MTNNQKMRRTVDLSINEISIISDWLEAKAQLYGLTNEFRDNAII